jgi:general secretion pathway protein G
MFLKVPANEASSINRFRLTGWLKCVRHWGAVQNGFTLLEVMLAVAIVMLLGAIGVPNFLKYRERAQIVVAVSDIRAIEKEILIYRYKNDDLPDSLADVKLDWMPDPWGNPYQYLKIEGTASDPSNKKGFDPQIKGKMRKDRFLVPVNSDYDLYSMGRDGDSRTPFTAKASRDDVVRCNDGGYVGLASEF